MAADLARDFEVTALDRDAAALDRLRARHPVKTTVADLNDVRALQPLLEDADLVIGAVPGFMGFRTLQTVIEAGKDCVDISFFPEDAFLLDELAQRRGVTVVVDCGVAPGMGNIILGYWTEQMKVTSFECMVGGLPFTRTRPFEYKAPFSPVDVLEEYTRPARYVENGHVVVKPALSDPEFLEFERIGTLEAFNTDGLRTLLRTMKVPNMKEKTLRYPGHIGLIQALKAAGFFSTTPLEVNGQRVAPFDVTAQVLFDCWRLEEGEEEFTVGRFRVEGEREGLRRKITYDLFDVGDRAAGIGSMARTTGYVCTAVARLVLEGRFVRKGICPPEYVGREAECAPAILDYLRQRNVVYKVNEV
jgi:saccharopine dehydrogenase-like NADP-dependent oxidoreductase